MIACWNEQKHHLLFPGAHAERGLQRNWKISAVAFSRHIWFCLKEPVSGHFYKIKHHCKGLFYSFKTPTSSHIFLDPFLTFFPTSKAQPSLLSLVSLSSENMDVMRNRTKWGLFVALSILFIFWQRSRPVSHESKICHARRGASGLNELENAADWEMSSIWLVHHCIDV